MNYKLSPSELTFLYDGCKRCFYLKVKHGIAQPSIPLPAIFTQIASLLKNHYDGKRTEELSPALPPGTVKYGEEWVKSTPIELPGHADTCFIKGRFDCVVRFDDGSYGIIDFKTASPKAAEGNPYSRQLHAYAYALEHPAAGSLGLAPVSMLGLLYFNPTQVSQQGTMWLSFDAQIQWVEIPKDEQGFLSFASEVMSIIEADEPPPPAKDCSWCRHISQCEGL